MCRTPNFRTRRVKSSKVEASIVYPLRRVIANNTSDGRNAISKVSKVKFNGLFIGYTRSLLMAEMAERNTKDPAKIRTMASVTHVFVLRPNKFRTSAPAACLL